MKGKYVCMKCRRKNNSSLKCRYCGSDSVEYCCCNVCANAKVNESTCYDGCLTCKIDDTINDYDECCENFSPTVG